MKGPRRCPEWRGRFSTHARALLVSHWAVGSDAAVKLTTRPFAELKARPEIGRTEAMRVSVRELIENGSLGDVHPRMWAPFVVVVVGGAQKSYVRRALTAYGLEVPEESTYGSQPSSGSAVSPGEHDQSKLRVRINNRGELRVNPIVE
jgi:hypothetical protein